MAAVLRNLVYVRVSAAGVCCAVNPSSFRRASSAANLFAESNPRTHSLGDVGRFYTPVEPFSKFLYEQALPVPAKRTVDALGKLSILIRKPAIEVIDVLRDIEEKKNNSANVVLYGKPGTGKSYTLAHIVNFCQQSDWIVVHWPSAFTLTTQSGDRDASLYDATKVDQNVDAANWLQYFIKSNMKHLKQTPLRGTYTWGAKKTVMPKDSTLLQLAELGTKEKRFAVDVVGVLLKELREHATEPILLAMDDANALLEEKTMIPGFDSKKLLPSQLALVEHFLKYIDHRQKLPRGAIVLGTGTGQGLLPKTLNAKATALLGGAATVSELQKNPSTEKKFVKVHVPAYNNDEIESVLKYYRSAGWLSKDFDNKFRQDLKHFTDNVPKTVTDLCRAI